MFNLIVKIWYKTRKNAPQRAKRELKKLCEVMLHDYRAQKDKIQELTGENCLLSWLPGTLHRWEGLVKDVRRLAEVVNELPPVEFLKFSVKNDDRTIHTHFLLRDPYRDRQGDSTAGIPGVNVLEFRLSEASMDKTQMGKIAMDAAEARSLDIHFERVMEKWIMFLDTDKEVTG